MTRQCLGRVFGAPQVARLRPCLGHASRQAKNSYGRRLWPRRRGRATPSEGKTLIVLSHSITIFDRIFLITPELNSNPKSAMFSNISLIFFILQIQLNKKQVLCLTR